MEVGTARRTSLGKEKCEGSTEKSIAGIEVKEGTGQVAGESDKRTQDPMIRKWHEGGRVIRLPRRIKKRKRGIKVCSMIQFFLGVSLSA